MIVSTVIGCFTLVVAGETDNYLSMDQQLTDASTVINTEFNSRIQFTLEQMNSENHFDYLECAQVAGEILKSFGVSLATDFESWVRFNDSIPKFPSGEKSRKYLFNHSIYDEKTWNPLHQYFDWMIKTQIDPVINIGGVYIGLDKITHFTASGFLYYKTYQNGIKNGLSTYKAEYRAILNGIKSEKLLLGICANGIFSYADLESNYQGLQLGIDLCSGETPVLKRNGSSWIMTQKIDLRKYVNSNWDESYNPCGGFHYKRPTLRTNLMNYCQTFSTDIAKNRFDYYDSVFVNSHNMDLLDSLRTAGKIPDNRMNRLPEICIEFIQRP